MKKGETDEEAVLREIREETGYKATKSELEFLGDFHFKFTDFILEFPTYRLELKQQFQVNKNPQEHLDYKWVSPEECYALPNLIRGFHELLRLTGYITGEQKSSKKRLWK